MEIPQESKYLVEIETLEPSSIKAMFTAVKEQLPDANIIITPEGLSILQMDSTHVVVCQVELKAAKFDKFICKRAIKLGVNIADLVKVLKGVGAKDSLTLFVEDPANQTGGFADDNDDQQHFGIRVESVEKGQVSTIYIGLHDINEEELDYPDLDYPYYIYMPSSDLQSIANNLKNMEGDVVQIRYVKGVLSFYTRGETGRFEVERSKTAQEDTSLKVKKMFDDADEIIETCIKLKKFVEFSKGSFSTGVTIYLKNDFPTFFEYDVGSLGFIRFGISPHKKPDNF